MVADLYRVLGISDNATPADIRRAYKKRSLETHPDRFTPGSQEQQRATANFQEVNNAYYILSDPSRRRDYDAQRSTGGDHGASGSGGGWSSFFGGRQPGPDMANDQFSSVFEEMMQDEADNANFANTAGGAGQGTSAGGHLYGLAGGAAGAVLGFICANIPGMLVGAAAGNRLGAIRDQHKKPVYEVFQNMAPAEKARLLQELLKKVMAQLS